MKSKILLLVGMFAAFSAYGETDYIDMQIHELEVRRDELKKQIAECEQNTRGYKIAGIATLGATGVGVVGNIKLAQEIKKLEQSKNGGGFSGGVGGDAGGLKADTRSEVEKWEYQCKEQGYEVTICDECKDCCAASGCPCKEGCPDE